jgi:uncharacterized membrane protein
LRRVLGLLASLLYPLGVLLLLHFAAKAIPGYAAFALKLYPVAVNFVLLISFYRSLKVPPTMIERFARLRRPDLGDASLAYTRRLTEIWCLFFFLNGTLALALAAFAGDKVWALYNGLIAYLLMGLLFALGLLFRPSHEQLKS